MLEKLVRELVKKRSDMERDVFASPPQNWDGFQRRLGQYTELNSLIEDVAEIMSGKETDE